MDADACPQVIKSILYRAADRVQVETIFVANVALSLPDSPFISGLVVDQGFDVADFAIAEQVQPGDLVITADIPLAAMVVDRDAYALNPRGEFYTRENVQQKLVMRNLMSELRDLGQTISGPPPLNQKDRQTFANQLDSFLMKNKPK